MAGASEKRTPINVRRKRGRARKEQKSLQIDRKQNKRKLQDLKEHLKRRRVEGRGSETSLSEIIKKKKKGKGPVLSGLESLPPELIEQIFLDCLECNLPLASPYIAAILSRESLYRLLIRVTFFDPPDHLHDLFYLRQRPSIRFSPDQFGTRERGQLQNSILRCRWFNADRLFSTGKEIFQCYANECWFQRCAAMEDNERLELEEWLRRGVLTGRQFSQLFTKHFKDERQKELLLMSDTAHGLLISQYASNSPEEAPDWPMAVIFPSRCFVMPDNRLRGNPWTFEKVQFLKDMAPVIGENRFGMPQSEKLTYPPLKISTSAVHEGIESAIAEDNVEALTLLLKDYLADKLISPGYFLSAIYQPAGAELLKALITYRPLSLPHDDSEITQFAMTLKERGDAFGDEILDHMLRLPALIARQEASSQSASNLGRGIIHSPALLGGTNGTEASEVP